jgi:hypothetical protein
MTLSAVFLCGSMPGFSLLMMISVAVGRDVAHFGSRHGRIGISEATQIGETWAYVQIFQKRVVLREGAEHADLCLFILEIAKDDGVCRTCLLAGRLQSPGRDLGVRRIPGSDTGANLCFLDTLDAKSAFFHHTTHPDSDVRVFL